MVLLLAKNSKAGRLFRPNFLMQVVTEIQKMGHPVKNFQSTPLDPVTGKYHGAQDSSDEYEPGCPRNRNSRKNPCIGKS